MKGDSTRIFYGERPITTTLVYGANDESWMRTLKKITLKNGQPLNFYEGEKIEKIINEAPLGKRFGTVDLLITTSRKTLLIEVKPWEFSKNDTEDRLEKQIRNYSNAIEDIRSEDETQIKNARPNNLVGIVHNLIRKPSREVYLIIVTSDMQCPEDLAKAFDKGAHPINGGWLGYRHLHAMLVEMGYRVDGARSQLYSLPCED